MAELEPPLAGERKQVTAVFLDIVNFSRIASTADVEDLQNWLDDYYQKSGKIIEANGGEVTEYLGDGLVAVFGLSKADELAPLRAVHAAIDSVKNTTSSFGRAHNVEIRAGVATGEVVVRPNTPRDRWPRLTGSVTTLAQRVQEQAQPNSVLLSESTERLLRGKVAVKALPAQKLKGFADLQQLFVTESASSEPKPKSGKGLVGRRQELAQIEKTEGPTLILGQAGIGKSALAAHVAQSAGEYQIFAADGLNTGSSYHPFKEWLFFRLKKGAPSYAELDAGCPGMSASDMRALALILGLPEGQSLLTEVSNLALKGRIESAIWNLITSQIPDALLVFEDLHWFDAASLDALHHILEKQKNDPSRRIVITSRPHSNATDLVDRSSISPLPIQPLPEKDAADLLVHLSAGRLSTDEQARLLDRASGIPLFIEQLFLRGPSQSASAVPETLAGLLAERIDNTGPAKALLQKVSALGRVFSLELVEAIAPEIPDAEEKMNELVKTGVLRKRSDKEWAFRHAMLGDAAYQSVLRSTRRNLHRDIAAVLQHDFPDIVLRDPAILAEHQRKAGALPEAVRSFLAASKTALLHGAFTDAETHARRALSLSQDPEIGDQNADLEIECHTAVGSVVMQYQGFTAPAVRDAFAQVHNVARTQALPGPESCAALFGSFSYAIIAADKKSSDEFRDLLSDLAERAPSGDTGTELRLASLAADNCARFYEGNFTEQFDHMADIRDLYAIEKHAMMIARYGMDIFAAAQMFEAPARAISGQTDQVLQLVEETDRHQDRLNIAVMQPYALIWGAVPLYYAGYLDLAQDRLARGQKIAEEQGAVFWQLTGAAWDHVMSPKGGAQLEDFRQVIATTEAIGANIGIPYFRAVFSSQLRDDGRVEDAYTASLKAVEQSREGGFALWYPEILRLHARNCMEIGRQDEAFCAFDLALHTARLQKAPLWILRILLDQAPLREPDPDEVAELFTQFSADALVPEIKAAHGLLGTS